METHHSKERDATDGERLARLLPHAIQVFRREVRRAVDAYGAATGDTLHVTDTLSGVAAFKLDFPAGAVRFRFSAHERLAVMFALFRRSPDQLSSAEMQLRANVVVREGELWFEIEHAACALSAEQLAERWLTWFFERI